MFQQIIVLAIIMIKYCCYYLLLVIESIAFKNTTWILFWYGKKNKIPKVPTHTLLCAHSVHMGANVHSVHEQIPAAPGPLGGPPQPRISPPSPHSAPMGMAGQLGEAQAAASAPELLSCALPSLLLQLMAKR